MARALLPGPIFIINDTHEVDRKNRARLRSLNWAQDRRDVRMDIRLDRSSSGHFVAESVLHRRADALDEGNRLLILAGSKPLA